MKALMKDLIKNNLDVLLPAVLVVAAGYAIMFGVALMCKVMVGV